MSNDETPPLCACGCGEPVPPPKPYRARARYIYGHQARDNSNARKGASSRARCGKRKEEESYGDIRAAIKRHEAGQKAKGMEMEPVSYCSINDRMFQHR